MEELFQHCSIGGMYNTHNVKITQKSYKRNTCENTRKQDDFQRCCSKSGLLDGLLFSGFQDIRQRRGCILIHAVDGQNFASKIYRYHVCKTHRICTKIIQESCINHIQINGIHIQMYRNHI